MAILSVIRRWHVREGVSIREISRRTKLLRNTIRKHLANGALEAVYPKRRSRSKVDGYAELLASWLKRESARGRKERRNLKQLHGELMKLGYTGSYDRVAAFARVWRRHYLSVLQRKPGALRNGAPFAELPQPFKRLQAARLKRPGGDREMVEILALVLHHDEPAVLRAAEIALAAGAASKQHVLNILSRLLEASPPSLIDIPDALTLLNEPKADVHRYDRLRGDGHVI